MDNTILYNKYIAPNHNYIREICKSKCFNQSDVDDVNQECLMQLFKYIHTYNESKSSIKNWIRVVSVRLINKIILDKKNKSSIFVGGFNYDWTIDEDTLESEEPALDIHKLIDEIRDDYGIVLKRQLEGFSIREISEMIGKNESAVKNRGHWSRKRILNMVNENEQRKSKSNI